MLIPLATDIKTRTGAPDKDARQKNSYIEVKGEQAIVRKRPSAQGGVSVGTGTAQGGYGLVLFWADTVYPITSSTLTTCNNATNYVQGDHVTVDAVDYWATGSTSNTCPSGGVAGAEWSTTYVPAAGSASSWTLGTMTTPALYNTNNNIAWNGTIYCYMRVDGISGNCQFTTSTNGLSWTTQAAQSFGFLEGPIIYGNGTFLQLSGSFGGTCYAATSPDGTAWTQHTDASLNDLYDVAWNGTVFCGTNTQVYTSPTGAAWTSQVSALTGNALAITWNGTVFCAVQTSSTLAITSPDGTTWTSRTLPATKAWNRIKSNGSIICIINTTANDFATSSDNGASWTQGTLPITTVTTLTSGNGIFLAVGESGASTSYCTSADGLTWTLRTLPLSSDWQVSAYGAKFVVMDSSTNCATSTTGL